MSLIKPSGSKQASKISPILCLSVLLVFPFYFIILVPRDKINQFSNRQLTIKLFLLFSFFQSFSVIRVWLQDTQRSFKYRIYSIKRRPRSNATDGSKITNKRHPRINAAPNQKNAAFTRG